MTSKSFFWLPDVEKQQTRTKFSTDINSYAVWENLGYWCSLHDLFLSSCFGLYLLTRGFLPAVLFFDVSPWSRWQLAFTVIFISALALQQNSFSLPHLLKSLLCPLPFDLSTYSRIGTILNIIHWVFERSHFWQTRTVQFNLSSKIYPSCECGGNCGPNVCTKQKCILDRELDVLVATPGRFWDIMLDVGYIYISFVWALA